MIHGISQHDFYFIFEHVTCFILINMETAIFLAHLVQYEMVFLEYEFLYGFIAVQLII